MGIYLSKYIHMLKSYPRDFQAVNVWWTCPHNKNLMKYFTWKRSQCNAMKKKIHLSQQTTKKLIWVHAYEYQSANYYPQHSLNSRFCIHTKTKNKLERDGTTWNVLELLGTSWKHLEQAGTIWNHLEQGGTTCNKMDSATNDTKNEKFIGRNCAWNTIVR